MSLKRDHRRRQRSRINVLYRHNKNVRIASSSVLMYELNWINTLLKVHKQTYGRSNSSRNKLEWKQRTGVCVSPQHKRTLLIGVLWGTRRFHFWTTFCSFNLHWNIRCWRSEMPKRQSFAGVSIFRSKRGWSKHKHEINEEARRIISRNENLRMPTNVRNSITFGSRG